MAQVCLLDCLRLQRVRALLKLPLPRPAVLRYNATHAGAESEYVRAEINREVRRACLRALLSATCMCLFLLHMLFVLHMRTFCVLLQANGAAAPFDAAQYSFFGGPEDSADDALEGGLEVTALRMQGRRLQQPRLCVSGRTALHVLRWRS